MKSSLTQVSVKFLATFAALAGAAVLGLSLSSGAADAPAKGAELLLRSGSAISSRSTSTAPILAAAHGSCGGCASVATTRGAQSAKGAQVLSGHGASAAVVSTHGCGGCSTAIGVAGHGKAKVQTVAHACAKSKPAAMDCCK